MGHVESGDIEFFTTLKVDFSPKDFTVCDKLRCFHGDDAFMNKNKNSAAICVSVVPIHVVLRSREYFRGVDDVDIWVLTRFDASEVLFSATYNVWLYVVDDRFQF